MLRWGLGIATAGLLQGCLECLLEDCESSHISVRIVDPGGAIVVPDRLSVRIDGGIDRNVDCDERLLLCTFYVGGQFDGELAMYGPHTYTFTAEDKAITGEALEGSSEIEIDFDEIPEEECCGKYVARDTTVYLIPLP